jgi:hypothetical protein
MSLKKVSFILSIAAVNFFLTAVDSQAGTNDSGERVISAADARISLVLVDDSGEQKSYRWGVTRSVPLKVVQGWFAFDDEAIREHGGGGREVAEIKPMQLSLQISEESDYLVLNRGYEFSGIIGDQRANIANKTQWPNGAELKSYYLSEPAELTDKLQPLWKGEFVVDEKVVKSVVYAVRVVGENASNDLFDANNASEALEIGRKWAPSPDPAKLIFEGKTIGEWIAQWDTRIYDQMNQATAMLTKIGKPAVPFMIDIIKKGDNNAGYAREVLGKMGPDAQEALDWLIETAGDKNLPDSQASERKGALQCLGNMSWASERLLPVFAQIAEDPQEELSLRQIALSGLSKIGKTNEEAMNVLKEVADSNSIELRDSARGLISQLLVNEGKMTRGEYYAQLVEQNPFDPSVPSYLGSTKGIVNSGKPHPLTEKVKAMQRERLKEGPDPELAWTLASIIENQLRNTELEWAAPTDSSRGRSNREDPKESFTTLAQVLELGFEHSQRDSELRQNFGITLAKLLLLQGNWDGMNENLQKLGQEKIPAESRPWFPAPPVDWTEGLAAQWQICDESMRSGDCNLEFKIEKDGKGLKGVHVLVKKAPEQTNVFSTGISADTLFLAPYPLFDRNFSFGYRGSDREQTRYAISDDSGVVRFEKLPEIPVKIEVLVPTSNFPEAVTNWDLWMEVEPDQFKIAKIYGSDAISPREPPAVVTLRSGETAHYPKLVVRPAFSLNIMDMDRVDKDNFTLKWQGLDLSMQQKLGQYELEMSLTFPSESRGIEPKQIETAKHILIDTEYDVGSIGVGGMHLEPGNIYLFEVKAFDKSGTILARWPKTRVWVPWGYRKSNPPITGYDFEKYSPIYHEVYFRSNVDYGNGKTETLPERVERFLAEQPDAFEREYVQMGKAWLDWHIGDIEGAKEQLEKLVKELPKGNLARGTAVSLLLKMDNKEAPPKSLIFVPDSE